MKSSRRQKTTFVPYLTFLHALPWTTLIYLSFLSSLPIPKASSNDEAFLEFGFGEEGSDVSVSKGGTARFDCSTFGKADVQIQWRKDNVQINPDTRISVLKNGSLVVRDVIGRKGSEKNDEGMYQCTATIEHGETTWTFISRKAKLEVDVLPRFVAEPSDRIVKFGERLVIPCRVDTKPTPAVRWYKDNVLLQKNAKLHVIAKSNSLEIREVKKEDEGVYRCKVSSQSKYRESRTGKISVTSQELLSNPSGPVLEVSPRSQVGSMGESVVLECAANGFPQANIEWLKDEHVLDTSGRLRSEGTGSLFISDLSLTDSGVYTCRASNNMDSVDATATVKVQVPPKFTVKPENMVSKETNDVEFKCSADGEPGPSITWYKNGEVIVPSEYFVIEGGSLKVLGLVKTDSGVYQCLAENPAGSIQSAAQLHVQVAERRGGGLLAAAGNESSSSVGQTKSSSSPSSASPELPDAATPSETIGPPPPSEPLNLKLVQAFPRQVSLKWDPPLQTNGQVTVYSIFYKEQGSARERVMNVSSTKAVVDGLQPETVYNFRAVAYNADAHGLSSAPLKIQTEAQEAVPGAVRNLGAIPQSSDSIEIRWDPPKESDVPLSFYKLFYSEINEGDLPQKETQIQVSRTYYLMHGLKKFRWYEFRVECHGDAGSGPSSNKIRARTISDLPSAPPAKVRVEPTSAQTVVVGWEPPPSQDQNGLITGYKIRYKEKRRGSQGRTMVTGGSKREHPISGLNPASPYLVRIAAMNQNGTGPASEWIKVTTYDKDKDEEEVPGPPTSLRVQARSQSIIISWTPPLEDGIMIRGYLIGWGVNVPDVTQKKVSGDRRYYTIDNLRPNRNYIVSLRAFNLVGNGFPIYETVRTVNRDVGGEDGGAGGELSTPLEVRAQTVSSTAIRLTWIDNDFITLPMDGRRYNIRLTNFQRDSGNRYHYVNSSELSYLMEELNPDVEYDFQVRAVRGQSASGWSMTATNRTLSAPPSSSPQDITIHSDPTRDPTKLIVSWQPPRHANGKITEYMIFYTDDPTKPDQKWNLESVNGDELSAVINDLVPQTSYYFKMQAVGQKGGYGPLSAVHQQKTVRGVPGSGDGGKRGGGNGDGSGGVVEGTTLIIAIAAGAAIAVLLIIICGILCCRRKSNRQRHGYIPGKKSKTTAAKMEVKPPPDLWIHHDHARRGSQDEVEISSSNHQQASMQDLKEYSQPPSSPSTYRYQALSGYSSRPQLHNLWSLARIQCSSDLGGGGGSGGGGGGGGNGGLLMTQSAVVDGGSTLVGGTINSRQIGRARPIRHAGSSTTGSDSSKGTLTRSYHQSSGSLERQTSAGGGPGGQIISSRGRTPQVVYTGPRNASSSGHQTDYENDHLTPTPPPGSVGGSVDGNRTIGRSGNPLKSFTHSMAGVGPPPDTSPTPARALVRPLPITVVNAGTNSPGRSNVGTSASGKPAGIVIGTKAVMAGRSPITRPPIPHFHHQTQHHPSVTSYSDANPYSSGKETDNELQHSYSTEELNVQIENLDTLMEDLHAMSKNEFNVT